MSIRNISPLMAVLVAVFALSACDDASETVGQVVEEADDTVQLVEFCTAALDAVQAIDAGDEGAAIAAAQTVVEEAPEEIAPEAQTVLEGIEAAQNGDPEALRTEEFQSAASQLESYTRDNCNPAN